MRFEEYAEMFETPNEVEDERDTVVLACSILAATDRSCRIGINGAQFECDTSDIIDIEDISMDRPVEEEEEEPAKGPRTALITVDRNTVLHGQVPVHAAFVAAAGTWMWALVPVAAAEEEPAGSATESDEQQARPSD
jgi:hypothetical protein